MKIHSDSRQGYTTFKPEFKFEAVSYSYNEDAGTKFELMYDDRTLLVSSVCDGHSGYMTAYSVTSMIKRLFSSSLEEARGDLEATLQLLFKKIEAELLTIKSRLGNSGTTCNVTVIDPQNEQVVVASLGDSPTLIYEKNNGKYFLKFKSVDQDCADKEEIQRMVQVHKDNGDNRATPETVVFEIEVAGTRTGVFRNTRSYCMTHSSFGDYLNNYYPGMVNTVPRIYTCQWKPGQVLIQCSDGLMEHLDHRKISIQPQPEFRAQEIATHLDMCENDENVAHTLHEMQINSMYTEKLDKHPTRADTTREWVETTFDNHITNVFMS